MAELIRGKSGRVYGNLIGLLTVMKSLPLAYNKDLQEDKEGMFDTVETITVAIDILAGMLNTMTVNDKHMAESTEKISQMLRNWRITLQLKDFHSVKLMKL